VDREEIVQGLLVMPQFQETLSSAGVNCLKMPSDKYGIADAAANSAVSQGQEQSKSGDAGDQSLLAVILAATPAQRLAWLEEVLHLAYASGTLKPRGLINRRKRYPTP